MRQQNPAIAAKIRELEEILDSGASSTTVDGQTTTFDLPSIRSRIRELRNQLEGRSQFRQFRFTGGYDGY